MNDKKWSLRRATRQPFECWVGVITIVNIVAFLFKPNANPIHQLITPWDYFWVCTYGLAGVFMWIGLARKNSAHIEAAGLCLLLGGVAVQLLVYGSLGVTTLTGIWGTLVTLGTLIFFAGTRLVTILKNSSKLKSEFKDGR